MPTLYVYLGIRVFFFGDEHLPIHVHGRHQERESKAEIFIENGQISDLRFKDVTGRPPLKGRQLQDFKTLVTHEAKNIVESWNEFFKSDKHIEPQQITRRIK
jgi:hypothetical protein